MSWQDIPVVILKMFGVDFVLPELHPPSPPARPQTHESSRCLFLDLLPTDVQLEVLHIWIAEPLEHDGPAPIYLSKNSPHSRMLRTLSALDVACCSRSLRPHIISLIHSCQIASTPAWHQAATSAYCRISCLYWAQSRQVVIDELFLDKDTCCWLARMASSNLHVQSTQTIRLHMADALRGEVLEAEIQNNIFVVFPKCMSIQHNSWFKYCSTDRCSWSNAWQTTYRFCDFTELEISRDADANVLKETITLRCRNLQSLHLFPQHIQLGYQALAQCPQLTTIGFRGDWPNRLDMYNLLDVGQHQLKTVKLLGGLGFSNEWLCFAEMLERHPWIVHLKPSNRISWDRSEGHLNLFWSSRSPLENASSSMMTALLERILIAVCPQLKSMQWISLPQMDQVQENDSSREIGLVENCLSKLEEFAVRVRQWRVTTHGATTAVYTVHVTSLAFEVDRHGTTNHDLHCIALYFPNLRCLRLWIMFHMIENPLDITDAGMIALLLGCPRLASLYLDMPCPRITKQTLYTIVERKLPLTLLAIDGNAGFTQRDVQEFKEFCREQQVVPVPRIELKDSRSVHRVANM